LNNLKFILTGMSIDLLKIYGYVHVSFLINITHDTQNDTELMYKMGSMPWCVMYVCDISPEYVRSSFGALNVKFPIISAQFSCEVIFIE